MLERGRFTALQSGRSRKREMKMNREYSTDEPTLAAVDAMQGAVLLEFGTAWCGFCRAAQPLLEQALAAAGPVTHLKVEDGPGRPLGRAFRVKLWPTLVFMRDGVAVARVVRPNNVQEIADGLQAVAPPV